MKKSYSLIIWILVAVVVLTVLLINISLRNTAAQGAAVYRPLPASLDALYPTNGPPTFLIDMFAMATPFAGIAGDLAVGHFSDAKADFDQFKEGYIAASILIPEWEHYYPMKPVDDLEKAFATNDGDQVMAAYGNVGKVCASCHENYIVRVEQKYHWGNFDAISVNGQPLNFVELMQNIDANFGGLIVSLGRAATDTDPARKQNDTATAQTQLAGFNARFQTLKEACTNCHGTDPRRYYVDQSVQDLIDQIGQALSSNPPDLGTAGLKAQQIGTESCAGCHLVHFPAALAKF